MAFEKRKQKKIKVRRSTVGISKKSRKYSDSNEETERIVMKRKTKRTTDAQHETYNTTSQRKLKLIKGGLRKNSKRKTQSAVAALITIAIIIGIIVFNAVLPTGLVEWSQNEFSAMGSDGGLTKSISGDKIDDLRSRDGELFVMSDSFMYAYNTGGKCITTVQHGYNSPCLETSFTRTLIYDRGSYGLRVDSLYTNFINTQLDNKIITADICDKGFVAVATESNEYSAEVTVYDDKFQILMRWSPVSGQVSSVKLSPNGKYLAASVVTGKSGDYHSQICLFEIKSAKVISTNEYAGSMFVKSSCDNKFVTFVGIDEIVSLDWNGAGECKNEFYRLEYFDSDVADSMIAVYHPDGDDRHFTVAVLESDGNIKSSIVLQGNVDRAVANDDCIYTYDSGAVNKFDFNGNKLSTENVGYEYVFMTAHKNGIGITYDMKLDYIS